MRAFKCIAFCLLVAGTAVSQDSVSAPTIGKRDEQNKVNHPADAKIQAIHAYVNGGQIVWMYLPEKHFAREETHTWIVAPPGDYFITTGDSTILKIVEEGTPGPQPKPKPGPSPSPDPPEPEPDPKPNPSPKMEINWAVWVYEQTDAVDQLAQTNVRQSIETRNYLKEKGIVFAAYDDDQKSAKAEQFREAVDNLPAIVLMQDSKKFSVHPAPASLDELKILVKEVSGE